MHHKPVLPYCGLTIILSHISRFDVKELLSGYVGDYVFNSLKPISRYAIDIRLATNPAPLLAGTRVVLLLGSGTLGYVNKVGANLDNIRGSCFNINGVVFIPSYFPQDAFDRKNYEATLNPNAPGGDDEEEIDSDDDSDVKDKGKTSRKNYRFWLGRDCQKAASILKQGYHPNVCEYKLRPNADEVIAWMDSIKDTYVYFDIETEISTGQITCFGISTDASKVYTVPIIGFNWQLFYDFSTTARIFRALCGVFNRNTIVIHNALFDLFILTWKYKIPPPKKFHCTMSMWHRCYCEVEKSLGHVISAATHEVYHKDEIVHNPHNLSQETQFLTYNAKDVERLALCHKWLLEEAKKLGAESSCEQVNKANRLYLLMMYRGLAVNNDALCSHIDNLTRRVDFFENRILPRLVGHTLNPRSPQQVAKYLYVELGLEKPKDPRVSLTGKKTIYKLLLKHNIPSLKVIVALRKWSRERGQLSFNHWQRDGVVTCAYKTTGTKSFRLSSSTLLRQKNRKDTGYGTNLQNWNKDRIRHLIIPFNL